MPFLDVLVTPERDKFTTNVFTKLSNANMCLNAQSDCPARYKRSVISSYVNRAFTHCSSWKLIRKELDRISQVLVNNGYSSRDIQNTINNKFANFMEQNTTPEEGPPIKLYYKAFMSTAHKTDERVIQEIITRGISTVNNDDNL